MLRVAEYPNVITGLFGAARVLSENVEPKIVEYCNAIIEKYGGVGENGLSDVRRLRAKLLDRERKTKHSMYHQKDQKHDVGSPFHYDGRVANVHADE
jgi:hypothetical protein